jgi:uncharacterized protein (TIGR03083 family)
MKPPIDIVHLIPGLNNQLISFLESLSIDDWQRQTVASKWRIKDVAAHLLDGNYRQISLKRDGWSLPPETEIRSNDELVTYLNRLNDEWVRAARRLSPAVLIELLKDTNEKVYKIFKNLDPFAPSVHPVSWAGETVSYNWFDIAREYTERWLHQQQIRDAMGNKDILNKELYHPLMTIFMHAWPVSCATTKADEGTVLKTVITGEGGGEWFLLRSGGHWKLSGLAGNSFAAETIIDGDIAWKLFSKSVRKENIKGSFEIRGNEKLGERVLEMVSVMA